MTWLTLMFYRMDSDIEWEDITESEEENEDV